MVAGGVVAGLVVGAIYAYLSLYNPFVYFTVIATMVFGAAVGGVVGMGASMGSVRAPYLVALIGFAMGLVATYLSWVFYVHAVIKGDSVWEFNPVELWDYMAAIAERGVWKMRSHTPKGTELHILWVAEAATVSGIAGWLAHSMVGNEPYCEACGQWTSTVVENGPLSLSESQDLLRAQLESGQIEALLQLPPAEDSPYTSVNLHCCAGCGFSCLSVDQVSTEYKRDEVNEKREPIVRFLMIDADQAVAVMQLWATEEEAEELPSDAPSEREQSDETAS